MIEVPETWSRVLKALLSGSVAWRTPGELAESIGRDVEETTDDLALLDEAGWIDVWQRDAGPAVTLSALGAERLGVRLVERGPDETPRWSPVGDPEPPRPKAKRVCSSVRAAALEFVIDPYPSPDVAAERAERTRDLAARATTSPNTPIKATDLPRPTLLIGQGLTPWPGPAEALKPACPACAGRVLDEGAYCLCCDRWGLDVLLGAALPSPFGRSTDRRRTVSSPESAEQGEAKQRDGDRARRKARRRSLLSARVEEKRARRCPLVSGSRGPSAIGDPIPSGSNVATTARPVAEPVSPTVRQDRLSS